METSKNTLTPFASPSFSSSLPLISSSASSFLSNNSVGDKYHSLPSSFSASFFSVDKKDNGKKISDKENDENKHSDKKNTSLFQNKENDYSVKQYGMIINNTTDNVGKSRTIIEFDNSNKKRKESDKNIRRDYLNGDLVKKKNNNSNSDYKKIEGLKTIEKGSNSDDSKIKRLGIESEFSGDSGNDDDDDDD
jgi:hypothetical protein